MSRAHSFRKGREMAHFIGDVQGSTTTASRIGGKKSGISGHIRGWNIGAMVICKYDPKTDKDTVYVYKTTGSSGSGRNELIARFEEED